MHRFALTLSLHVAFVLGCVSYERGAGLDWHSDAELSFEVGRTTESDVLAALGPPSQLISLGERSVFYYLREETRGRAAVLVFYNRMSEDIRYETAVFFFDAKGVLTDWAQKLPGGHDG
jgi:hypothetical protein